MFILDINVTGFDELERRLSQLALEMQGKAIKAAARYAMKPALEDAQANVPVRSGLLRSSLRMAARTTRDPQYPFEIGITTKKQISYEDFEGALETLARFGAPNARVAAANSKADRRRAKGRKFKVTRDPSWRVHFVETGAPNKGQPARPFLRPALENNRELVVTRFRDRLNLLITRAASR